MKKIKLILLLTIVVPMLSACNIDTSETVQDSKASALAAQDDVTREIDALRQQGRKNQAKAIQAVIDEMN